ncbi:MAG: hypothetical protein ACI9MC_002199 [Kiritimatiellia bacterium]|jgi:hypothetical protein
MKRLLVILLSLAGCPGETTDATDPLAPNWNMMSTDIPGGVLLSAWSHGDELLMVGGELRGPDHKGLIARYRDGALCTEAIGDRTLWWVHGHDESTYYIVGEQGTVLRFADGELTHEDVPTQATLFGVWDEGDVTWAVGGNINLGTGEIWVRRQGAWSLHSSELPALVFKVWNGWFVGDHVAWRMEDDKLVEHPPAERLLTVSGDSSDDVWAVGGLQSARVMHFEQGAWTTVDNSLGQALNGVWTGPGEDVWVAGNFGTLARFDGSEWHKPTTPLTEHHFHAIYKHGDEVFAVGGNMFSTSNFSAMIARYSEDPMQLTPTSCP